MPDTQTAPMSPVAIEQGLTQLLTTQFGVSAGEKKQDKQKAVQQVATDEGTDTTDELGATDAEDLEVVADADAVEGDEPATDEPEFALDLKVNGEDIRITDRAEAVKLAQLGKHFTQRNEEVIRLRNEVEQREAEAIKLRDQYAAYLPEIEAYLANPLGERPKREGYQDELSYLKADKQWAEAQERVGALKAERQRVAQEQAQQRDAAIARWVREQDQLVLAAIPEWHDPAVMRQDTQAMAEYARKVGISDQALQNPLLVRDKAFVTLLRDATRFQQMQAKGATEVKKVQTQVAAPGAAKPAGETVSRRRKEIESKAKSGRVDDIAVGMTHVVGRLLDIQHNNKPKR